MLFFTGLVIGYHRERIGGWLRRVPTTPALVALSAACGGLIWFHRHSAEILGQFSPDGDPAVLTNRLFEKSDVRIGRLVAFAVFFLFAMLVTTIAWTPIYKALGWFLMPLGQSALLAYSTHLFVIAFFTRYTPRVPWLHNTSAFANTLVQLVGISLVYGVVQLTPAMKTAAASARETVAALLAPSYRMLAPQMQRVVERWGR